MVLMDTHLTVLSLKSLEIPNHDATSLEIDILYFGCFIHDLVP